MFTRRLSIRACTSELSTVVFRNRTDVCHKCKFFRPETNIHEGFCTHPAATTIDVVSGYMYFENADAMRSSEKACGESARLFEKGRPLSDYTKTMICDTLCWFALSIIITFVRVLWLIIL